MRVLIDTNIVLDFLLQREPFFQDAELLFQAIEAGQIIGYVTATTLTDIFYISRKHTRSVEQARQAVSETLTAMVICPIDRAVLESAFNSGLVDFEDAVQIFGAVAQGLDAILTRDSKGFLSSPIPVLSIQETLQQLGTAE
ncbi:MAG: PIN domain-containing protein [Microcoleus sp. PH2017_10_PVI_O_A]|uniref:type II toxin-antitoxin system VapC family toxin n=1 Tax=unclassified Microcoleus TaxID=2642155 RepID=UPI001DC6B88E|nr:MULTISPECIES: PIN domain-containing protein [unclassified Microcoleus]TAE79410.1 MAG: PIN domain-containing protein [Oscillatoriales cyanobacterium]MCC3404434.1 PIN domain-containing protein [Microcoleus sp. PH2017_10_PVI_O_A]MCC3458522.1 PIN domain-containing protein [Microcoleus sp. PH2017_11_PCY_U_A]MCC3529905.1 PIN domain-containing protein [Microcoleus sp. PH2017_21_RUC_O_A]MCC3542199.1 PIN domain-containing protein [Microcoleus sp. PH2017_22_RUC_O_B]